MNTVNSLHKKDTAENGSTRSSYSNVTEKNG